MVEAPENWIPSEMKKRGRPSKTWKAEVKFCGLEDDHYHQKKNETF